MSMIDIRAFSLAAAILWGCGVMFLGWMGAIGWARPIVEMLASGYIGYAPSFIGGIIGGVWGFFDALIGAAILTWLYNTFIGQRLTKIR